MCIIWWNDCHRKLNLTLKEVSKNEKNHHKFSLRELYFFTKEFFSKPLLIVYDTCQLHICSHMGCCKYTCVLMLYPLGLIQTHVKGKERTSASSNSASQSVAYKPPVLEFPHILIGNTNSQVLTMTCWIKISGTALIMRQVKETLI